MTKITHPSMGRATHTSAVNYAQNTPQSYVVDDATDNEVVQPAPEVPQMQFKAPPKTVENIITSNKNKLTLESLIFAGKITKKVEVPGGVFEISTLTNDENTAIVRELMNMGIQSDLLSVRALTLAMAVKTFNDMPISDFDVDGEFESDYHKKIAIINKLQLNVVEKLYIEYGKLTEQADEAINPEEIKK